MRPLLYDAHHLSPHEIMQTISRSDGAQDALALFIAHIDFDYLNHYK
jgi:hypothetical protein